MQKRSYDAVDLLKWICSWLVMYIHLAPVITTAPGVDRFVSQGLCRIAVPFFFAASAFFLFQKMGDPRVGGRENAKKLLRFCGHIFLMYTVWIAIYSAYYAFYNAHNGLPQKALKQYVLGFFFKGELQQHLWYLIATVYAAPVVYLLWRCGKKALIAAIVVCEALSCIDGTYRFLLVNTEWLTFLNNDVILIFDAVVHGVPMMCVGVLCVLDYRKHSSKQWSIWLAVALVLYVAETAGLYLYYGNKLITEGMVTRCLITYCLLNWLFTVDFRLPGKWLGKALRLSSTWNYCAHMLVLMLFHWVFGYQGFKRYVVVCGLTVISGIPYIAIKLLMDKRRKNKMQRLEMRG